jgi:hypothetical protein
MPTVQRCWIRNGFGLGALILTLASGMTAAAATAAVSGVVRNGQGVTQMGALVEVLAAGSRCVGTAFTDMDGHYRIANLAAGKYQLRATAVLFAPAIRSDLRLAAGMRATVNLTLNMLSAPTVWLPAERRRTDEPDDDWTWTLRSAANRAILRLLDDGDVVLVGTDAGEIAQRDSVRTRATMQSGSGGFGEGGIHGVALQDRARSNGSDAMMRADVAVSRDGAPSMELAAGLEHRVGMAGQSRLVMSVASHPEMMSGNGVMGMQTMRMASAQKMQLGDSVDVEAGGTVYAIHTSGTVLTAQPFLRVTVHPGEVWAVRYRLANSRETQGFDGLDSIAAELPVAVLSDGRMRTESGSHQEIAVSRRTGGGVIQAAVYHDAITNSTVVGGGALSAQDLAANDVVVDTTSGSFEMLGAGYTTDGVSIAISEPLTQSLWAALEYESGAALTASAQGVASPVATEAASVALKASEVRTGTTARAAYRWQPERTVTAVAPYDASDAAYFSFYVRQAVRWGDRLPPGIEATVDVTNLLAEGYRPFLSADGRTLFLAQAPRTICAGLSFTF